MFFCFNVSFFMQVINGDCFSSSMIFQGVVLDILVKTGVLKSHHFWLDVENVQEAIQNVMICVEMVVFSVIQQYAFHVQPYTGTVQTMLEKGKKNE